MIDVRKFWILACVGLFLVSCSSKAKEAREVQDKLAKWEKEHQAQAQLKTSASPQSVEKPAGQRADGVVARVNQDVIFFSELEQLGKEVFQRVRNEAPPGQVEKELQEVRRALLERLIDRTLLEQEAERRRVLVSNEEVDASLDRLLKQRNVTKEQFYVEMAREKIPPERFREKLRREMMVMRMLDLMIRSHIHVSDQQCNDYYEKNRDAFSSKSEPKGEGIRIQQIILMTRGDGPAEKANKLRQIEEIRARIVKGEEFGKMARQFSQGPNPEGGGDCGYFKQGEMLRELDEVAFRMQPGEVSPVIETQVGFHLLKIMGSGGGQSAPPDVTRAEIRAKLEEQMYQEEIRKMIESLRKSAFIDIRL
jgi:parvulin-like peptidyl-prolyl isomerase